MKPKMNIGTVKILSSIFLIALLFGCVDKEKEQQLQQLKSDKQELEQELIQKDQTINQFLQSFNDIEENLASIKEKEDLIAMQSRDPELQADNKEQIINDIQMINTLMEENREKIGFLQKELERSGMKVVEFEKTIGRLKNQMEEKNQHIEQLKDDLMQKDFQIASLNEEIDTLATQISNQSEFIESQDKELNTTYFTAGTYKELKETGIIETNGLFPWLDKNKKLNEELPEQRFKKVDMREFTSVPLQSEEANLITNHPDGTYKFEKTAEGQIASLEITKPNEFWRLSNYLVVEVK